MRKAYARHRGLPAALALATLLAGASACSDTDERPATWSYISASIIQPNCGTSRCHSEGSAADGYIFDKVDVAYETMIKGPVCIIVLPGNPEGCNVPGTNMDYPDAPPVEEQELIRALTGSDKAENGAFNPIQRMPIDEPLPEADIELIRKWIAAGAPRN